MGICRSCANPVPSAAGRCAYCGSRHSSLRMWGYLLARITLVALLSAAIFEWQGLRQFLGGLIAGIFHG